VLWQFILAGAVLNAMRGGNIKPAFFPLHARYWAALGAYLMLLPVMPWQQALLVSVALIFWAQWPWGRWYTLNRLPRDISGPPNRFEDLVEHIGDDGGVRRDAVCLWLRMLIGILPIPIAAALFLARYDLLVYALFIALAMLSAYAVGWAISDQYAIRIAEFLSGGILGAAVFYLSQ
jgi:hypothetical protein